MCEAHKFTNVWTVRGVRIDVRQHAGSQRFIHFICLVLFLHQSAFLFSLHFRATVCIFHRRGHSWWLSSAIPCEEAACWSPQVAALMNSYTCCSSVCQELRAKQEPIGMMGCETELNELSSISPAAEILRLMLISNCSCFYNQNNRRRAAYITSLLSVHLQFYFFHTKQFINAGKVLNNRQFKITLCGLVMYYRKEMCFYDCNKGYLSAGSHLELSWFV